MTLIAEKHLLLQTASVLKACLSGEAIEEAAIWLDEH